MGTLGLWLVLKNVGTPPEMDGNSLRESTRRGWIVLVELRPSAMCECQGDYSRGWKVTRVTGTQKARSAGAGEKGLGCLCGVVLFRA